MEFFSITSLHVCLISGDNSQLICQAIINDYLKYQIRSVYSLAYLIQCILEAILKRSSHNGSYFRTCLSRESSEEA